MIRNLSLKDRLALAQDQSCSLALFYELAKEESLEIRAALAENPNCPLDMLYKLAGDREWEVSASAARNPNATRLVIILSRDAKWRDSVVGWEEAGINMIDAAKWHNLGFSPDEATFFEQRTGEITWSRNKSVRSDWTKHESTISGYGRRRMPELGS